MTANNATYIAESITFSTSGSGGYSYAGNTKGERVAITERVDVLAADADADTWTIGVIPSSAIVSRGGSNLSTTEITAGTDYDLGLYDIDVDDANWLGTVVDADLFMDGQTMATASLALSPVSAVAATDFGKQVWELLGLSEDPKKDYLVVLTANTAGSAAGSIGIELAYT